MSLQVWIPFTDGTLKQQGLSDATVSSAGTINLTNAGKLGKCITFTSTAGGLTIPPSTMTSFTDACSVAFWFKINDWGTSYATYFQAGTGSTPWNNYIFGFLRYSSNSTICFTISNGSSASNGSYLTSTMSLGVWYHVAITYETGKCRIYLNGELDHEYTTTIVPAFDKITKISVGRSNNDSNYQTQCNMNDLRIYDHALSKMEIKELSKGLVLHYPLSNISIQQLNNCYNYPTFDTSASTGGWYHWGSTGHQGTYGQSTDSNYIYRKDQSYAHWVADGAEATYDYLLYQSPEFDGGHRSLQCICKEENSLPIVDESIVRPAWNGRSGGAKAGKWTSIIYLGNGFYHCKVEDIQQDGSNDLVGFYVKAGYKVYFSEAYLENDRTVCSDMFYSSDVIKDASGLNNNGTKNGSILCDSDTPKYCVSMRFDGSSYILSSSPSTEVCTLSAWLKINDLSNKAYIIDYKSGLGIGFWSGYLLSSCNSNYRITFTPSSFITNQWNHVVIVKNSDNSRKCYINGIEQTVASYSDYWSGNVTDAMSIASRPNGSTPVACQVSDVRLYSTALLADDVKALYEDRGYIDNKGNVYGTLYEIG